MITTLLDNDFYQFTMANCIWEHGNKALPVRYEFRNRTFAVPLASRIDLGILRQDIERLRSLYFKPAEISYLRSTGYFSEDFLSYLQLMELPEVEVRQNGGHLVMEYEGPWSAAIFLETPLLALVNHMYYKQFGHGWTKEGEQRLLEKIDYLKNRPSLKFVEFGTRRRFTGEWQKDVLGVLLEEIPDQVLGTSNVALAAHYGIKPIGTMAHQLFMVMTAITMHEQPYNVFRDSANRVLQDWTQSYRLHPELMTVLPDTYTTKSFFANADIDQYRHFTAFRQDSGDPIEVGRRIDAIQRVLEMPRKIVFSDSLDVRAMSVIEDNFSGTECVYGWGTNLTNDLGYEPLSIVIKPCAVKPADKWLPCVKVSDDVQKATGDAASVKRYMELL